MLKILLPVDGSANSLRAVQHVIDNAGWFREPLELHLLTVQLPVASGMIKTFIKQSQLNDYYRDEGLAALMPDAAHRPASRSRYALTSPDADETNIRTSELRVTKSKPFSTILRR